MAYKVNYHGYEVICDDVSDLQALVNHNGNQQAKPATVSKEIPDQRATSEPSEGVVQLIAKLKKEQRDVVRQIATMGKVSRDRLRQVLGITDPHKFAGRLISISKSAAGSGINSPIEILYERENGRGPRTYSYKIKDNVKVAVKEALQQYQ